MRLVPVLLISAGLRPTRVLDARSTFRISPPPRDLRFQPDSFTTAGYSLISASAAISPPVTREKREAKIIRAEKASKKICSRGLNVPSRGKCSLIYIWKRQECLLFDRVARRGSRWHLRWLWRTGHLFYFQDNAHNACFCRIFDACQPTPRMQVRQISRTAAVGSTDKTAHCFRSKCARQTRLIFSPEADLTHNSIRRKGPTAFSLVMNLSTLFAGCPHF